MRYQITYVFLNPRTLEVKILHLPLQQTMTDAEAMSFDLSGYGPTRTMQEQLASKGFHLSNWHLTHQK